MSPTEAMMNVAYALGFKIKEGRFFNPTTGEELKTSWSSAGSLHHSHGIDAECELATLVVSEIWSHVIGNHSVKIGYSKAPW